MNNIPKRISLVAQTLDLLRSSIQSGIWQAHLPSEASLCAKYQVSRSTLRQALTQLTREGYVKGGQGRRRRIVKKTKIQTDRELQTVAFLTPYALHELPTYMLYSLDELRDHLFEAGLRLEVHVRQNVYSARPDKALEELIHTARPAAWILYHSTPQMQRWFTIRGLPCVVCGSLHVGNQLPSIDVDYRATCRHAAQLLLARGHRRIALLMPDSNLAGDVESQSGFMEAAREAPSGKADLKIIQHQRTVAHQCKVIDRLMKSSQRPTSIIVTHPNHALTTMGYLMKHQIHLPGQVSLISRDDDHFFSYVVPSVARYSVSTTLFCRKICRIALELVQSGSVSLHTHRLLPEFIQGETLDAPAN